MGQVAAAMGKVGREREASGRGGVAVVLVPDVICSQCCTTLPDHNVEQKLWGRGGHRSARAPTLSSSSTMDIRRGGARSYHDS